MSKPARITSEMLSAYLDGELNADELAQVDAALNASGTVRAELDELQRQRAQLQALPKFQLPADFAARCVLNQLPPMEPASDDVADDSRDNEPAQLAARQSQVAPVAEVSARRLPNTHETASHGVRHWAMAAATLAATLLLTMLFLPPEASPIRLSSLDSEAFEALDAPQLKSGDDDGRTDQGSELHGQDRYDSSQGVRSARALAAPQPSSGDDARAYGGMELASDGEAVLDAVPMESAPEGMTLKRGVLRRGAGGRAFMQQQATTERSRKPRGQVRSEPQVPLPQSVAQSLAQPPDGLDRAAEDRQSQAGRPSRHSVQQYGYQPQPVRRRTAQVEDRVASATADGGLAGERPLTDQLSARPMARATRAKLPQTFAPTDGHALSTNGLAEGTADRAPVNLARRNNPAAPKSSPETRLRRQTDGSVAMEEETVAPHLSVFSDLTSRDFGVATRQQLAGKMSAASNRANPDLVFHLVQTPAQHDRWSRRATVARHVRPEYFFNERAVASSVEGLAEKPVDQPIDQRAADDSIVAFTLPRTAAAPPATSNAADGQKRKADETRRFLNESVARRDDMRGRPLAKRAAGGALMGTDMKSRLDQVALPDVATAVADEAQQDLFQATRGLAQDAVAMRDEMGLGVDADANRLSSRQQAKIRALPQQAETATAENTPLADAAFESAAELKDVEAADVADAMADVTDLAGGDERFSQLPLTEPHVQDDWAVVVAPITLGLQELAEQATPAQLGQPLGSEQRGRQDGPRSLTQLERQFGGVQLGKGSDATRGRIQWWAISGPPAQVAQLLRQWEGRLSEAKPPSGLAGEPNSEDEPEVAAREPESQLAIRGGAAGVEALRRVRALGVPNTPPAENEPTQKPAAPFCRILVGVEVQPKPEK